MKKNRFLLGFGFVLSLSGMAGAAQAGFVVFESAGLSAAAITPTVDGFRASLGALNANDGSHQSSGRREINWDAVPDASADPNPFPGNFFNSTTVAGRSRGALFTTPGTGFLVSADSSNPTTTPPSFGYPSDFVPFSAERLFTPVGSNIMDALFFVPGTTTPGTVSGFGAVFSDVEVGALTRMEFFDALGNSLFSRDVMAAGNGGLSFLGVMADAGERIASVRISLGDIVFLGGGVFSGGTDTVVMDDFVYGEPLSLPEPGTAALFGVGWLAWRSRKRT